MFSKLVVILLVGTAASAGVKKLTTRALSVLHEWKDLDFNFPYGVDEAFALENGLYVKGLGVPVDFAIEYGEQNSSLYRTFVTIPRLNVGIPYTLASFQNEEVGKSPMMFPYPNYFMHSSHGADCNGITSAIRIFIDECWRLWVVDSGQIASVQFCPPQILAFDLTTDRLIHRYVIPEDQYMAGISVFTSAVADVRDPFPGQCKDTKVYITDPWQFGLIVYDSLNHESWRIQHDLMRPDGAQLKDNYVSDGIFTVSISPKSDIERKVYFHALNSKNEIVVPLSTIDDQYRWQNNSISSSDEFKILGNRRIQCESEAIDSSGNLYCSLLSMNAIISWDKNTKYNSDNLKIYAHNPEQLQFVTSMRVVKNSYGEDEIWILSNDPKLFFGGKTDENDFKFRLVGCRISEFYSGRKCTVDAV